MLPGSQRTPLHLCHTLRSRPNLGALPLCGAPVLPPLTPRRRLQRQISFRDSITWLWHSLSTLRAALLDDDARLASGWWLTFSGWDWLPTEFFRAVSAAPPLLLGFSWREEFGHFLPVSRSETTMVAVGLSPRTTDKHTIRRRGATVEQSNTMVPSTVATRRVTPIPPPPWTEVHGYPSQPRSARPRC